MTDSERILLNLIREAELISVARIVDNAYIQAANGNGYPLDLLQRVARMEVPVTNYITFLRAKLAEHEAG